MKKTLYCIKGTVTDIFCFIKLGMALDLENDEHECYLLDWLVTQVISIIKI